MAYLVLTPVIPISSLNNYILFLIDNTGHRTGEVYNMFAYPDKAIQVSVLLNARLGKSFLPMICTTHCF